MVINMEYNLVLEIDRGFESVMQATIEFLSQSVL